MLSSIYAWTNGWVNNREAGDLRRHRAHYDVIAMKHHMENQIIFSLLIKIDKRGVHGKSNIAATKTMPMDRNIPGGRIDVERVPHT